MECAHIGTRTGTGGGGGLGIAMQACRREVEEDLIFGYMKAQEHWLLNKQPANRANLGL